MDTESLQSLVVRAQAGDLDAYGEVVGRFQDMAYGYAYAILGDFHAAEDATQEAFVAAYRDLPKLENAAAFPGWFRRIVQRRCGRLTRGGRIRTVPLDAAEGVASDDREPSEAAERREMKDAVLEAVRSLPAPERTATTLFYINGYSQNDIAGFLEVPVSTVKNRLAASRKRLKQRMMKMVANELKSHPLPERLPEQIGALLSMPRPLEIEGHPIREAVDLIRGALPGYEMIDGDEVVEKRLDGIASGLVEAFEVDEGRILRTETTVTTFGAMVGRTPPVRIVTAGRVFRDCPEDASHHRAFHQFELLCIEQGADVAAMKAALTAAVRAVLPDGDLKWDTADFDYPKVDSPLELSVQWEGQWLEIAGCGILTAETLTEAGYDPGAVAGFAFGLGLERVAMLRHGLDDVRALWRPPYVP